VQGLKQTKKTAGTKTKKWWNCRD